MFEKYRPPKKFIPSDPRFGCGPSLIPEEYVQRLAATGKHLLGTSHRRAPVKNLVRDIQEGLAAYFSLPNDYQVIIGTGGATLLFDMIALGAVEKKVAHFSCGEFSVKWWKSSDLVPWIEAQHFSSPMGSGIELKNVADADVICGSLNETSTGVQLDTVCSTGPQTLLAIDATSGAGQIPLEMEKIDIYFFSPQKIFSSEGGMFIAILSPKAKKRVLRLALDKTRYIPGIMNWQTAIENAEKGQTYSTPSICTLFFLKQQIDTMNKVGYKNIVKDARQRAEMIYGWAEEKDYLSPYVKEKRFRSLAVATIDVDDKIDVTSLLATLEKQRIVYGIESYRKLARNQFRISFFYNIKYKDLEKLLGLLSHAIESI